MTRRRSVGRLPLLAVLAVAAGAPSPAGATPPAPVVVGTGTAGAAGVGGPATRAELRGPTGLAVDAGGDLFVADTGNCRVVEVPSAGGRRREAGHLAVVAGGRCAARLDPGRPATDSGIGFADAVAVDRRGDLFIADTSGNRILMVPAAGGSHFGRPMAAGHLYVVAGTGAPGYAGDGGPARAAELDDPQGLAVDAAGDLFVADTANCRVREIAAADTASPWAGPIRAGAIATVAGDGRCGTPAGAGADGDGGPALDAVVWDPTAVAVDPAGDLFIADRGDDEIRAVAARSGTFFTVPVAAGHIATVAGTGYGYGPYLADGLSATGETASINFPEGIALDAHGDLVIADAYDRAVREVWAAGPRAGTMTTVDGALLAGPDQDGTRWVGTPLAYPWGVAVSGDTLYVSDQGADQVRALPLS